MSWDSSISTSSLPLTRNPAVNLPAPEGSSTAVPVRLVNAEGRQLLPSLGTVTPTVGEVLSTIKVLDEEGTAKLDCSLPA